MIIFSNFKTCEPATDAQLKLSEKGVMFCADEAGRDWYDIVKELAETNPSDYKVQVESVTNKVVSFSRDASSLFPSGSSVVVVGTIPTMMANGNGSWMYDGNGYFVVDSTAVDAAENRKSDLLAKATALIQTIAALEEDGIATEAELSRLKDLKTYRVAVLRTDTSSGDETVFPVMP